MADKWRLNDEEVTDERCYDAAESAGHGVGHGDTPPLGAWVQINNRYGPAPMLSLGTYRDLQEGDSVVLDKNSRSMDWSQCPETNEGPVKRRVGLLWTVYCRTLFSSVTCAISESARNEGQTQAVD